MLQSRTARGLSALAGLAVAASVLAAPAPARAADAPAPQAGDLCGLVPLPGCETVPLPDLPLPDLPLPDLCVPTLPGVPLPPICLPGTGAETAPNATTAVSITVPAAGARTGQTLTAKPPTWDQPDTAVTTIYAWKRDGVAIPGATTTTYKLVAADVGRAITVVATGATSTTTKTDSVSAPVTPAKGLAPKPTTAPRVEGTPATVGSPLRVTTGTWADPQPTFTYQWFRALGGRATAIPGATSASYQPTGADAGRQVVAVALATTPGYETGFGVSDYVDVPQLTTTVRAALVSATTTTTKRASLRIAMAAADGALGGRVEIYDGVRRIRTVTVQRAGSTVTLPRLSAGVHRLTVLYRGDTGHGSAASTPVRLTVRKAR